MKAGLIQLACAVTGLLLLILGKSAEAAAYIAASLVIWALADRGK